MTQPDERSNSDDLRRVSDELSNRLTTLGIRLSGAERPEELLDIVEAVERFEAAVERRGGDLMMDEAPRGQSVQPDDRHFALPLREGEETVSRYLERLAAATDDVRRHGQRAD